MITIWILVYLYEALQSRLNSIDVSHLVQMLLNCPLYLLIIFILMPINWLVETLKWNRLISIFQKFSLSKAYKVVLASLSFSLITPNRIGDFAVRLILVEKQNRWLGAYASFISSFAQLSVTIIFGLLCLGLNINSFVNADENVKFGLEILCYLTVIVILLLFIKSNALRLLFYKLNVEVIKKSTILEKINSRRNRVLTLSLSLIRYLVFFVQFALFALIFGEEFNTRLISSISIIFLFTTVIPSSWLSEIAVRAGVSFYVFESLHLDPIIGLSCSICLWVINIFLPAIFGLGFLNSINLNRNFN